MASDLLMDPPRPVNDLFEPADGLSLAHLPHSKHSYGLYSYGLSLVHLPHVCAHAYTRACTHVASPLSVNPGSRPAGDYMAVGPLDPVRQRRGHNYMGHNYMGQNYLAVGLLDPVRQRRGHNYIGHNYMGQNYLAVGPLEPVRQRRGHNYIGHNYMGPKLPGGWAA